MPKKGATRYSVWGKKWVCMGVKSQLPSHHHPSTILVQVNQPFPSREERMGQKIKRERYEIPENNKNQPSKKRHISDGGKSGSSSSSLSHQRQG